MHQLLKFYIFLLQPKDVDTLVKTALCDLQGAQKRSVLVEGPQTRSSGTASFPQADALSDSITEVLKNIEGAPESLSMCDIISSGFVHIQTATFKRACEGFVLNIQASNIRTPISVNVGIGEEWVWQHHLIACSQLHMGKEWRFRVCADDDEEEELERDIKQLTLAMVDRTAADNCNFAKLSYAVLRYRYLLFGPHTRTYAPAPWVRPVIHAKIGKEVSLKPRLADLVRYKFISDGDKLRGVANFTSWKVDDLEGVVQNGGECIACDGVSFEGKKLLTAFRRHGGFDKASHRCSGDRVVVGVHGWCDWDKESFRHGRIQRLKDLNASFVANPTLGFLLWDERHNRGEEELEEEDPRPSKRRKRPPIVDQNDTGVLERRAGVFEEALQRDQQALTRALEAARAEAGSMLVQARHLRDVDDLSKEVVFLRARVESLTRELEAEREEKRKMHVACLEIARGATL